MNVLGRTEGVKEVVTGKNVVVVLGGTETVKTEVKKQRSGTVGMDEMKDKVKGKTWCWKKRIQ